jgi:hypothetical protein
MSFDFCVLDDRVVVHAQENGRGISQPIAVGRPLSVERLRSVLSGDVVDWSALRWSFSEDGIVEMLGKGTSKHSFFAAADVLSLIFVAEEGISSMASLRRTGGGFVGVGSVDGTVDLSGPWFGVCEGVASWWQQ